MFLLYNSFGHTFCIFSATVTNLQQKVETLQTANTLMKEDLAIAKNNILELQNENSLLTNVKDSEAEKHQKQMQVCWTKESQNFIAMLLM